MSEVWCSRCEQESTVEVDGTGYCSYHAPCPTCGAPSQGRAYAKRAPRYNRCGANHIWRTARW